MAKKRVDPIKQREKRAKMAMIGLVVVLVLVAVYEVPSMMSVMNKKPPPGAFITDAGNRNPDGTFSLPGLAVPTGVTPSGDLTNTDLPPTASSDGQLVSFSQFEMKNPFAPQVKTTTAPVTVGGVPSSPDGTTTTPSSIVPAGGTSGSSGASGTLPTSTVPGAGTSTGTSTTTTTAAQTALAISVNGAVAKVETGGTFPTASPVFRLASWKSGSAQISIVGGSYAAGNPTLTLQQGVPITLQNTSDGKQYRLELLSTPRG